MRIQSTMERYGFRKPGVHIVALLLIVIACIGSMLFATRAHAQNTVSLTLDTTINADNTLTPKLTWSTTPTAQSCTASGDTTWDGTKAASGTQTLAAFPAMEPRGYALICNWPGDTQAALTWVPPTTFEPYDHDLDPATPNVQDPLPKCAAATDTGACLAGYKILFGTSPTSLTQSRFHMFPQARTANVTGLSPNTYHFAVQALTGQGSQSKLSNTVSKTIAQPIQVTQQAGIRVPSAPVMN